MILFIIANSLLIISYIGKILRIIVINIKNGINIKKLLYK